jgi:hypothetical protein
MSWSWLGLDFLQDHRDLTLFFPSILAELERSCCLITDKFGFAPCSERHVHRNHTVGAVRLVGVDG